MHVGCWSIQPMYTVGKTAQVAREMERYRLDLMGLGEIRWTGAWRIKTTNGYKMIYQAGKESDHQKSLIERTAVSSRIITVRFYPRFKNTTVIQVYARQIFYNQLHATFDTCNRHNVVMVIGDSANNGDNGGQWGNMDWVALILNVWPFHHRNILPTLNNS